MKIVDFFKNSRLARAGGFILFCSLMVMISVISLKSLPDVALRPALRSGLNVAAPICGACAILGASFLAFSLFKRKFGTSSSVFLTLFFAETLGAVSGTVIYLISLYARDSFLALDTVTSFYYYFLGLFIITVSLICAIATATCFLLFWTVKRAIKASKTRGQSV